MHNFKELKVWQKAVDLSVEVYKLTSPFPKEETFGLRAQVRNAAVSIASNIAEGAGRNGVKEFLHFLSIANGSANEVETQLIVAYKLNYITEEQLNFKQTELTELRKMIFAFSNRIRPQNNEE